MLEDPASDKDIELANKCTSEMTEALNELQKEMDKITKMPADPNYKEHPSMESDEDEIYATEHTPKEG